MKTNLLFSTYFHKKLQGIKIISTNHAHVKTIVIHLVATVLNINVILCIVNVIGINVDIELKDVPVFMSVNQNSVNA
jgi:hypothetical protein